MYASLLVWMRRSDLRGVALLLSRAGAALGATLARAAVGLAALGALAALSTLCALLQMRAEK